MIRWLSGICQKRTPSGVVINVQGVGYWVEMPLSDLCRVAKEGEELELWIHTVVKEDSIRLFGFLDPEVRRTFEVLISISGLGPKLGLAILSSLSLSSLKQAIDGQMPEVLAMVPGIGKRTAEKLIIEMKSKPFEALESRGRAGAQAPTPLDFAQESIDDNQSLVDLRAALVNLGFKEKDFMPYLQQHGEALANMEFSTMMTEALGALTHRSQTR